MKRIILFLLLLTTTSCEIIEEDISGRSIEVIAPAPGATVPAGTILFRWHTLDRATAYELSVFSAGRIVADTLLAADTLGMPRSCGCRLRLDKGRYEWIVAAFNAGYQTRTAMLPLTVTEQAQETMTPGQAETGKTPKNPGQ